MLCGNETCTTARGEMRSRICRVVVANHWRVRDRVGAENVAGSQCEDTVIGLVQSGVELPGLSIQPPETQPKYLCCLHGANGCRHLITTASMSKVTVLKVDTSCAKCKRKVLRAVSGLQGTNPGAIFFQLPDMDSGNATALLGASVLILMAHAWGRSFWCVCQVLTRSRSTRRRAR